MWTRRPDTLDIHHLFVSLTRGCPMSSSSRRGPGPAIRLHRTHRIGVDRSLSRCCEHVGRDFCSGPAAKLDEDVRDV
jgi:hypothetical protein